MGSVQRRRDGKTEKLPDMSGILQSLRGLAVPIEQLETDPENANVHSEASIEAIARSLNRFGQRKPIVVHKKTMTVKAGNGMFEAARSLGWSHIAAVVVDEEDLEAAAFALADNKTAELSTWDVSKLKEQLASFDEADYGGMSDLGWNPDELAKLLEGAPAPALKLKPGKGLSLIHI